MNITFTWEQGRYMDKGKEVKCNYSLQSDKGYRVSKSFYKDEKYYAAWSPKPREILKICSTSDEAKAVCELHYMENMK